MYEENIKIIGRLIKRVTVAAIRGAADGIARLITKTDEKDSTTTTDQDETSKTENSANSE